MRENKPGSFLDEARKQIAHAIRIAGGEKELAKIINVQTETVRSWVRPSHPRIEHLQRVIDFIATKGSSSEKKQNRDL